MATVLRQLHKLRCRPSLANPAIIWNRVGMSTMNVSLPDEMRAYMDEQVDHGRYGSSSEYVRALIRHDQDRRQLRTVLLAAAESETGPVANVDYFAGVRRRIDAPR
jgi:antitoxin ParD1/3/4